VVKKNHSSQAADNAFAKKALEAISQIEEEAQRKKSEQLEGLREALKNIQQRINDLEHQRTQVEEAIGRITGRAPAPARRTRSNHDELRGRILRWLGGHAGEWFTAGDLQREFPELEKVTSVAMFLKKPVSEGQVKVDKSGGNRNTKYGAGG
jgi:DNA repair exonuclease SbcCD ATPase subunit